MGKFKRIQVPDIKAMGKTLDDLPDKSLGKTREEAVDMLNAQITRALEKGYSVRELTEIMARGNVSIPAAVIRAKIVVLKDQAENMRAEKTFQSNKKPKLAKPVENKEPEQMPDYFTPDTPDSEL